MEEKKLVPKRRFKGFKDEWRKKSFDEELELYSGLTYSPNDVQQNGTFVLRSSNVQNGEIVSADDVYVDSEVVSSSNVREGDIIVVVRNGSRSLIGKHAKIKKSMDKTVIGAFMSGIRSDQPNFINALLDTQNFKDEIDKNLGATINQITNGMFKSMSFIIPNVNEQQKIGEFFRVLDDRIANQERKIAKVKSLKAAYLTEMFPQEGETVPKRRFKGFDGEWKQLYFEDFTKLSQGLQIAIEKRHLTKTTNRMFYITNEFLNPDSEVKYYIETPPKSVVANKNDILMTRTGNTGFIVTDVSGAFHNNFFRVIYDRGFVMKDFLYYLLNSSEIQREILDRAGTSTIPDLNHNDFYTILVKIPLIKEQQKIGEFFKNLDNQIEMEEKKLDKLQKMKEAYLEEMFV